MPAEERGIGGTLGRLNEERRAWQFLLVAIAVYIALELWLTRGTTLFVDEINIFTGDRGFHPSALLAPLNGHLVLTERLVYAINFKLFGASFALPRLVEAVGASLAVVGAFAFGARRVGSAAALAPAVLLLFLGTAWELNFVVSGIGNVYAVAAGIGALLALERRDRPGDLAACVLLTIAAASFTSGVAFVVGAVVLLALERRRRAVWVVLVPIVLYAAWLVWVRVDYVHSHPDTQNLSLSHLLLIPNYVANGAASVAGALTGTNYPFEQPQGFLSPFKTDSPFGGVLALIAGGALLVTLYRRPRSPYLWAVLATLLAFWVALALGYGIGRSPAVARYVYAGAFLVLLVAAEASRSARFSPLVLGAVYAVAALALVTNAARLRDGINLYRSLSTTLRGALTSIELAGPHAAASTRVPVSYLQIIPVGEYLSAVERIGSPGYSLRELPAQSEAVRHTADSTLVSLLALSLSPGPAPSAGTCRAGPTAVRSPGAVLRGPGGGQLSVRRFAAASTVSVGTLAAAQPATLRIPSDRSDRPWVLSGPAGLTVCDLR